ncbi:MAG: hypothetical protein ACFFEE_08410 [Candidatus Thorarchaeota archaeon]
MHNKKQSDFQFEPYQSQPVKSQSNSGCCNLWLWICVIVIIAIGFFVMLGMDPISSTSGGGGSGIPSISIPEIVTPDIPDIVTPDIGDIITIPPITITFP